MPQIKCSHSKLVPIGELKPNPRNPKKHPPRQIALYARLIDGHGWRAPIVVSNRSGFIVKGHGALMAAEKLGCATVPVDFQDFNSEAEEWAHMIADNQLAEYAEVADDELAALLKELQDGGEIEMALTGFDDDALAAAINAASGESDVDAEPQVDRAEELQKEWGTAPGQLWKLGDHRLLCGDSTKIEDVERVIGGGKLDVCFTSPPYGVSESAKLRDHYVKGAKKRESFYDEHKDEPSTWPALMGGFSRIAVESCSVMACNVQMLAANKLALLEWVFSFKDKLSDVIIWDKGHAAPQMRKSVMSNAFEFVFIIGGNGSRSIPMSSWHGTVANVFRFNPQGANQFADVHRAVFPIELPRWIIGTVFDLCKSVYEPFSGSGTTIIACEQLGRKCRAIEISPAYVAVALQRFKDATGKIPTLEK